MSKRAVKPDPSTSSGSDNKKAKNETSASLERYAENLKNDERGRFDWDAHEVETNGIRESCPGYLKPVLIKVLKQLKQKKKLNDVMEGEDPYTLTVQAPGEHLLANHQARGLTGDPLKYIPDGYKRQLFCWSTQAMFSILYDGYECNLDEYKNFYDSKRHGTKNIFVTILCEELYQTPRRSPAYDDIIRKYKELEFKKVRVMMVTTLVTMADAGSRNLQDDLMSHMNKNYFDTNYLCHQDLPKHNLYLITNYPIILESKKYYNKWVEGATKAFTASEYSGSLTWGPLL